MICVGTFSKALFPALRIGYVILPRPLQARWRALRTHTDVQNPPFEQAALAEFLRTRKLDRHIRRMRRVYGERRQALLGALDEAFRGARQAFGDCAGLHLAVRFPGLRFDNAFRNRALRRGTRVTPVECRRIAHGRYRDTLLIG